MALRTTRLWGSPLWACLVCGVGSPLPALASPQPAAGPTLSSGVRRVADSQTSPPAGKTSAPNVESPPSHQQGRAPKQPRTTLPEGVPAPTPDQRARRRVALGSTVDERAVSKDPELRALAEAEKTMFASSLRGIRPGWSWQSEPSGSAGTTEVADSGLPPTPPTADVDSTSRELAVDAEWLRSLAMPDLPVRMDERVVQYLKFYRDSDKGQAIAHVWAKKAGRYAPALRAEFSKAGLPKDLIWLSLIESGHNPTIKSPAGAAGLWQFIPSSGRMYGLVVDRWVDERLDPVRSTQAAIRFLSDLYQRFGSWELAMGAYNMGYGGMSRAIKKFNCNDFWQLSRYEAGIPWETTLYVPKILAIAIVMNNKKAFGIDDVEPDAPERFDTVLVEPEQSLNDIARAASLPLAVLNDLNPHLLSRRTPPSGAADKLWPVYVPRGYASRAKAGLGKSSADHQSYRVRFGDTLQAIAEDYGTSEEAIASLNRLRRGERLRSGTLLLLPRSAQPRTLPGRKVVVVPAGGFQYDGRRRVFFEVRKGDKLASIASAFGVSQSELIAWNSLDADARLQDGMTLQVFVDKRRSLRAVRHTPRSQAQVLVVGTPAFYDHHEALNGRTRMAVVCKEGDTLASIGQRYGMSVGSMERVNRRSRRDPLVPGEKLIVYVETAATSTGADAGPVALGSADAPHPEHLPGPPLAAPGGASRQGLPSRSDPVD